MHALKSYSSYLKTSIITKLSIFLFRKGKITMNSKKTEEEPVSAKTYWLIFVGWLLFIALEVGLAIYFTNMHTQVGDAGAALMGGTAFMTFVLFCVLFY